MLLTALDSTPVLGVSLGNLSLLRLDLIGGPAPGNKSFKLEPFLEEARRLGATRLLSFGGAWSNHLHALAAVGREHGFQTVGVVRGEEGEDTATLRDARRNGMRLLRVSRAQYRRRHDLEYQRQLLQAFDPCLLIPEGGASGNGAGGCLRIAQLIREFAPTARRIVLPVGTGTTLSGVVAGLDEACDVVGIAALRGAMDLEQRVQGWLDELRPARHARWRILHEFHGGGFARVNARLREFVLAFEATHGIALDPVYGAKMLLAIHTLRSRGEWDLREPVLAIHTGGLQGRRGFSWLD